MPSNVVTFAKHSILDTLAAIIAGSRLEGIPVLVGYVREKGGRPESVIPFYGGTAPSQEVALILGTMARAADLGQVHEEAAHNSEYILPALLAATGMKGKVTGRELITSFVVGQETLIRIGMAFRTISGAIPNNKGGGYYIFGAVAGIGKLLGLSTDELENAQGIARGKTQPHDIAMTSPATLMIRVHHGFICRDAIDCCVLARKGITGPRKEVLGGPRGYLQLAQWDTNPKALTHGLGQRWEMLNVTTKLFASCRGTHTAIAGIIEQMEHYNFQADEIRSIKVDQPPTSWQLTCVPKDVKWNPQTASDGQFSLPYAVAAAAYDKKIFLDSFTPQKMARTPVRELMARISARMDPALPPWSARVTTRLRSGRQYSQEYIYIKGHAKNPATEQELVNKFHDCVPYSAFTMEPARVDSIIDSVLNLEHVNDIKKALLLPLMPRKKG